MNIGEKKPGLLLKFSLNIYCIYHQTFSRWIKFEEHAEDVLGRWSKPHVTTLTQTSIDDLNHLIQEGVIMLDLPISSIQDIAGEIINQIIADIIKIFYNKQIQ